MHLQKGTPAPSKCHQGGRKFQVAQQLTTTLLLSSTVNVMSSENDKCYQSQESGHMACHWPNIRCFNCDKYSHVAVDCPDRIPPSDTPAHHMKHHSSIRHWTRSTSKHHHRHRHRFSRSSSHSHTHRYKCHSPNNSHRSHSRSYHRCPHRSTSCH